ncbi:MAG: aminotransferase class IV [Bacteroidales bacterium]|nr:aminotransferase class IV [Bacteroidales bacterium]
MYFIGNSIIKNGTIAPLSEQEQTGRDGEIYELFRVENKKPIFLDDHLERFRRSIESAKKSTECLKNIESLIEWLIICNPLSDCNVRLCLGTDGVFQGGFVTSSFPTQQMYAEGVKVGVLDAIRENPQAKIYHVEMRADAKLQQENLGTYESLLVNPEGQITEGSRSNVFFIRDGEVYTSPDRMVLGGIIRMHVLDICSRLGITVLTIPIDVDDIESFDAAFITSTPARLLPLNQVDGVPFDCNNETLRTIMNELELEVKSQFNN